MSVPGWFDFADVYDAAIVRAPVVGAHFVETGTFFGVSAHHCASQIAASGKHIRFDTWDNWRGVGPDAELGYPGYTGALAFEEQRTREHLAGLPVRVCTGDALGAAQVYADESLDLVFLDDDHTDAHVAAECAAWWPRLKPGGLLAGHDYDWPSVQRGVHQWAETAGVTVQPLSVRCWGVTK